MKRVLFFLTSLFIGIFLFFWIINQIGWEEIAPILFALSSWKILIILGLTALMVACGARRWKIILKSQGYDFSFRKLSGIYLAGFSISYLTPMILLGGEIFRGYILKRRDLVPWQKGIASVIIDRILEWSCYLIIILAGLTFFFLKIGLPSRNLLIFFSGVLIFFILTITFFYFRAFKKESIIKFFIKGEKSQLKLIEKETFDFFKLKNRTMWKGFGLAFLRSAISFLRFWILIIFLGKNVGISSTLSILSFSYLSAIVPIPASLGSHDAAQVFAFGFLGAGANVGAAFVTIIRGTELILALVGVIILFRLGLELLINTLYKKVEELAKSNKNEI